MADGRLVGDDSGGPSVEPGGVQTATRTRTAPAQIASPKTAVVNKPEQKVDAVKLSKGRAVFADDMEMLACSMAGC